MTATRLSTRKYVAAYLALLLLSALTFGLSFLPLGAGEWPVALGIAVAKAMIVAWFFMHLVELPATHRSAGAVAAVLLAVLVLLTLGDVWTRTPEASPRERTGDGPTQPLTKAGLGNSAAVQATRSPVRVTVSATQATVGWSAPAGVGEGPSELPAQLEGVGVEEHLREQLPLDLPFTDTTGERGRLGQWLGQGMPTIVTLNYSKCPMLCSLELNGLVAALRQISLQLGADFRIVTVSLDPEETAATARQTRARYLKRYDRQGAGAGWRFLTGDEAQIRKLAQSIGFRYRRDESTGQIDHAAAIVIASPAGRIMRYLYGIEYAPRTLKLALVEASQGRIGTSLDRLILYCSLYDPREGSYAMMASRLITVGGLLIALGLLVALLCLWYREAARRLSAQRRARAGS